MSTNAEQPSDLPATEKQTGMRLRWQIPLMVLFFGPALFFARDGDYVLTALCGVAGISAFCGYRVGAVYILASIAAITAAVAYSPSIGQAQEYRFTEWFGTTGLANRFLSIGVVGLAITFILSSFVILLLGRILSKQPRLDALNRWLGLSIGAMEGLVAIVFFLGGILIVEPTERERAARRDATDSRGQAVSKFILVTAENVRTSRVGPVLESYNPFVRVPQLNKIQEIQQSVQVLSDPAKLDGLLHHPSIEQLQRRPEVRQVMQRLNEDPEIKEILYSGRPMDRKMAMTLLNHPAVLELVDQPGFMAEAAKVVQATSLFPHGGH